MTQLKTTSLSYSSMKTALSCQQKYWHKKVGQTPFDSDYEESDALGFGKAFHKVLETTLHTYFNDSLLISAMEEFKVPSEDRPLLSAMLTNYLRVHKASGLIVKKCELKLETKEFLGFIDFIAQADNGWWLGDNKTAARHDPTIKNRLHRDPQLNLYSKFADDIASALEMEGPFLGFRYRQSIKSKAGTPSGLAKGTPTYDIIVEADAMDPKAAWSDFMEAHQMVTELHNGLAPRKNYGACFDYFRPCEYFSQCHGCLSSEGNPKVTIHTAESLESADLL